MKNINLRHSLLLSFLVFSLPSYGLILYQDKVGKTKNTLSYDRHTGEYLWQEGKRKTYYKRHRYKDVLKKATYLSANDYSKLEKSLIRHAGFEQSSAPTTEDLFITALAMKDEAFSTLSPKTSGDCFGDRKKKKTTAPEFRFKPHMSKVKDEVGEALFELKMNEEGFFNLGELTKLKVELMTSNDNFLHGMANEQNLGLVKNGKGIEGDDRGCTFAISTGVEAEFEKGGLALRSYSKGCSRLAPQKSYITIAGKPFEIEKRRDDKGRVYQEFISVDGLELEVKKTISGKVYGKVLARREVLDDQGGLAKVMQENWHSLNDKAVQYNYVDHMEKRVRYSSEIRLGTNFEVLKTEDVRVAGNFEVGKNFTSGGDEDNYLRAKATMQAQYLNENQRGEKFPSWEAKLVVQGKKYVDDVTDRSIRFDVTKRYSVTTNGYVFFSAGISDDTDRLAVDYSEEEINRNGKMDLQHHLGGGFEYRW